MSLKNVAVIDYGMGNLASVVAAVRFLGFGCEVVSRGEDFVSGHFDTVIIPGVGAYQEAMSNIGERGLSEAIRKHYDGGVGKIFGICLGAQLMLGSSEEFGFCEGLGLMKGRSIKFEPADTYSSMTIPHIGWSAVRKSNEMPFWKELPVEMHMYFDHSFHFADVQSCFECNYAGRPFSAAFGNAEGSIIGVQFHPEKSGDFGLALLQKFLVS